MNKKTNKKIQAIHDQMSELSTIGELNRARSITVGTAFGGTNEVMMRRHDGTITFAILQPVETIELIHQLAAGIGCHIHLLPRKDFGSWRDWKYTEEELAHYRGIQYLPGVGHPPHPHDMDAHQNKGQVLPPPEQQPGLNLPKKEHRHEAVATQTPVKRRSPKRTSAST